MYQPLAITNAGTRNYYFGASSTASPDYVLLSQNAGAGNDPNIIVADSSISSRPALRTRALFLNTSSTPSSSDGVLGIYCQSTVATATLQVDSTTKGVLMPRMTSVQRNSISSPAEGLEVYDTDLKYKCFYNGTNWFFPTFARFRLTVDFSTQEHSKSSIT